MTVQVFNWILGFYDEFSRKQEHKEVKKQSKKAKEKRQKVATLLYEHENIQAAHITLALHSEVIGRF